MKISTVSVCRRMGTGCFLLAGLISLGWLYRTEWQAVVLNPIVWLLPAFLGFITVARSLQPDRWSPGLGPPRKLGRYVVPFLAILFAVWLSMLTLMRHKAMQTQGCDLGIFDNLMWNTVHGHFLHSSILGRHFFGEHVSPILLLLAPLYAFWSDARLLLVVQAVALAWAGLPIYRTAARQLGPAAGLVALGLYFSYIPLNGLYLFDFHEVSLALPLLAYATEHLTRGHPRRMLLFLFLALMCKEELALTVIAFGLVLMLFPRTAGPMSAMKSTVPRRQRGLMLAMSGLFLFILLTGWILPFFRQAPFPYVDRYSNLGGSLQELALTALTNPIRVLAEIGGPEKHIYSQGLFSPVLYLNWLNPSSVLLMLPTLARSLLSDYEPQSLLRYHFHGPLIPFVFFGLAAGLRWLVHRRWPGDESGAHCRSFRRARLQFLLLLLFFFGIVRGSQPASMWKRAQEGLERRPAFERLLVQIPPAASVCVHNHRVAQVSNRREVTVFPDVRKADWVLLDFGLAEADYPLSREEHVRHFFRLVRQGGYGIRDIAGKFVLLERGGSGNGENLAEAIRRLFLEYGPEDCHRIPARQDPVTFHWFPEIDHAANWLFPAGAYRVHFEVNPFRPLLPTDRFTVLVHPRWGEFTGHWSLAERTVTAADYTGGQNTSRTFTLEFQTSTSALIGLQLVNPVGAGVETKRIVLEPLLPLPEFADLMAQAYEDLVAE